MRAEALLVPLLKEMVSFKFKKAMVFLYRKLVYF
jgi:hypothetical protein